MITHIEPKTYILRFVLGRAVTRDVLQAGLELAGLGTPIVDVSDGREGEEGSTSVVAKADRPFDIEDSEELRLADVTELGIDPYADLSNDIAKAKLVTDGVYAFRLLSRMVLKGGRRVLAHHHPFVEGALATARFAKPLALSCMRADMRLPGLPSASHALWVGVARYIGPESHISGGEPGLLFETCALVSAPPAASDAPRVETGAA